MDMPIFRFFSGVYDSVKQRAQYLDLRQHPGPRQALIQAYKRRMRFDIAYRGSVVITDANYFDGFFFHLAIENEDERRDLEALMRTRLVEEYPVLDVRVRDEELDTTLVEMFGKPFIFSTIVRQHDQRLVHQILKDIFTDQERSFANWDEIFREVNNQAGRQILSLDRVHALRDILDRTRSYRRWGKRSRFKQIWKDSQENHLLHERVMKLLITEGLSGNEEVEAVAPGYPRYLAVVRDQLSRDFPNRSAIDAEYRFAKSEEALSKVKRDILDEVNARVYRLYNKAIAYQHAANGDVDIGESDEEVLRSIVGTEAAAWESRLAKIALEEPSWQDFWSTLSGSTEWENWLEYRLSPSRLDEGEVRKREENLFKFLEREFPRSDSDEGVVGGGANEFILRVKGFLSELPSRTGSLLSRLEFGGGVSVSPLPTNPTATLSFLLRLRNR